MNQVIENVLQNEDIPSPPSVAIRLLDLVSKPEVTVDEIIGVLGADPKLSARLIAYCNSPLVGPKRPIGSLQQAVVVLGMRTLRLLSLSFSVMDTQNASNFNYDAFWRKSLANAIAAKILGQMNGENGDEEFLMGLLFNVGQIGLGTTFPEQALDSDFNVELEREIFKTDRFEIGGHMLKKWHFPEKMVEILATFNPDQLDENSKLFSLGQTLGDLLISETVDNEKILAVRMEAERLFEMEADTFDSTFDAIVNEWKEYESLFDFDSIDFGSIKELEDRAKLSMIELTINLESEMSKLEQEKKELEQSSRIDVLTSLKNRAAYESEVPGTIDFHYRSRKSFGVIAIDIDHFKQVNDTYGHTAGDDVLKAIGGVLLEKCRSYDTVYRYGGEEFVAVVLDCDFKAVNIVAERFRSEIEKLIIQSEDQTIRVTASFGGTWVEDGSCNSLEDIFKLADANLYEAKKSGRNRVIVLPYENTCPVFTTPVNGQANIGSESST